MTELIDRNRIAHAHWQMRLGTFADPAIGEIAAGLDDLEQAINIVVLTEKGTVPLQPEMCCRLLPWIDKPPADAIPNFTREIWDALATWEPRIVVTKVAPIARGFSPRNRSPKPAAISGMSVNTAPVATGVVRRSAMNMVMKNTAIKNPRMA